MAPFACITVEFDFESSHQLSRSDWSSEENDQVFGNCARLHGHSYRLLVTLRGEISPDHGMVANFRDVKRVTRREVVDLLDHRHLNDVVNGLTTAENLCVWIARRLIPEFGELLHRVELWETATACAWLDRDSLQAL